MRVLIVSWEFPPLVVGGLGRHVADLSRALADEGHDVQVLTRGTGPEMVREHYFGVSVLRSAADAFDIGLGSESLLAWSLTFEHSLVRAGLGLVAQWRPDVIHAHDWLVAQTAQTLHERSGAPVVVTVHATEAGRQQDWLVEPLARSIHSVERWQVSQAGAVITCSDFMAAEVGRLFDLPADRIRVIGNGIAPAIDRSPPLDRSPTPDRSPAHGDAHLVFAGRLVHEKGLQELIKALPLIRVQHPRVRLTVAGSGPLLAAQQDRAERYAVADLISWRGFIEADELHRLMAGAEVVVVPSLYEPFGLVALEAQALGTPVAVSDIGGLRELVRPGLTGERFGIEDPVATAAAISRLLDDPARARELATRAQFRAHAEFSWSVLVHRVVAVYTEALGPGAMAAPTVG
jgi:glycogen(starch) synthase